MSLLRMVMSNTFFGEKHFIYPTDLVDNSQNGIEKISDEYREIENMSEIRQLTKDEYLQIVQEKRKEFIYQYFSETIAQIFKGLETSAALMKHCHYETVFQVPEFFDINKTENTLRDYFRSLGFETVVEPRKDGSTEIVLTLT